MSTKDISESSYKMTKKAYIYSPKFDRDSAEELKDYILRHVILNEEHFEIIEDENQYKEILQNLDDICFIIDLNEMDTTSTGNLFIDYNIR
jgi:hypothetical protein